MIEFGLAIKSSLEIIFKTYATNNKEAKEYFRRLKNLSEEEFNKLFIVIKLKR